MDNEELDRLKSSFSKLGLNDWLIKQCGAVGMKNPTPIQLNCVPKILEGRDCIGCAKTGSGKTAAFALPILQKLSEDPYGVFALVLTPTRELAFQISEQFSVLGKPIGVRVSVVTGGRDMVMQGSSLSEKPHILVSTPGRLADHIDTGTEISLKKIRFLVLDEADRLLEDNFGEQLQTVFKILPKKRQTLLFSATMTESIRLLQETSEKTPFYFSAIKDIATVDTLEQQYVLMPADVKDAYLLHMVNKFQEENEKSLIIVFTHTCKYCQLLGLVMKDLGLECVTLHSMIPQRDRLAALAKFKSHQVRTLIATDVASRGLDIPAVDFIINFNVPTRAKDYVHRVGRTARAGRGGFAVTLVTQFDIKLFHSVEAHIKTKLTEMKVNENEVAKIATEVAVSKRKAEIRLDEVDFGESKEVHLKKKLILQGKDPEKYLERKRKNKFKKNKGNKKKKVKE